MMGWTKRKRNTILAALIAGTVVQVSNSFGLVNVKHTIKYNSPNRNPTLLYATTTSPPPPTLEPYKSVPAEISPTNPLRVIIAGAGVGGLALANNLCKIPHIQCTVIEKTNKFKRFGGPIQLASNAMELIKIMDEDVIYSQILHKFTTTGDKTNGIKDGIRDEWYAKFDLGTPAKTRGLPYTGVIERPDLQEIYLAALPDGVLLNGHGVEGYETNNDGYGLKVLLDDGSTVEGDVLIGADGIWSAVRASMREEPARGEGSGCAYSGYTVFAGELAYDSFDNGEVGYKVYIGPKQYFVITDIGKGNYQWYAFLAREPGSAEREEKPDGNVPYLKDIFTGWSKDIHHILDATKEHEIEQRDLYDRPPSAVKPWTKGNVALLGDAIHAMMPNLGQGGCQAIEDAYVLVQELESATTRDEVGGKLNNYRNRRLVRSAAVQGLSRFASDIIIRGFDTPFKIVTEPEFRIENFNYAGIVTKMLQPILPIFFWVQFNFLYEGYKNEGNNDNLGAGLGLGALGGLILVSFVGIAGEASVGLGAIGGELLLGGGEVEGIGSIFDNLLNMF